MRQVKEERKMNSYKVEIAFTSDKPLTAQEIDTLQSILALQIEEPQNLEGGEENWTASNIAVMVSSK